MFVRGDGSVTWPLQTERERRFNSLALRQAVVKIKWQS